MSFSIDILLRIAIFILAVAGYFVARHIHRQKTAGEILVCPMNLDCHGVVHSDYSKLFGVNVEVWGMFYYGFIALSYLLFIFIPQALPNYLIGSMATLSIVAFIFSAYLVAIMTFVLKKGCYWCFVSATFCLLIFVFTLLTYDFSQVVTILG